MPTKDDEFVLSSFMVQRRLTKVVGGAVIGDPLWSLEIRYEAEGRVTTLEHNNIETEDAQDRILGLVKEMGASE